MHRMIADVMAAPVVTVQPGTSFRSMIQLLAEHQISALPVVDPGGHVLGIVSETDLVRKEEHQPREPTALLAGLATRRRPARTLGTTAADSCPRRQSRSRRGHRSLRPPVYCTSATSGTCP